jgi:N-methylhydantoinase B
MTNTLNTPIEALEYSYPFLMREYAIRRGTGGKGLRCGGDGLVREIQLLADGEATVLSERRRFPPYGLFGSESGAVGKNIIIHGGEKVEKPGKFFTALQAGDILRIETPGGGGYGKAGKE